MEFYELDVLKTKDNYHYIEWSLSLDLGDNEGNYLFRIMWSNDPSSGFQFIKDGLGDIVEIDGDVGPLVYTHELEQYDFNKDYYYIVVAILKSDTNNQTESRSVFYADRYNGLHETMRHAEQVLYGFFHGEPSKIIKRKAYGPRCLECWSPTRRQKTKSECTTCNGTGYLIGYFQPIDAQISFDSDPKMSDLTKTFEKVTDTKRARASNYPLVRPKDLIINSDDNKRYRVTHVETTKLPNLSFPVVDSNGTVLSVNLSKQNYIVSQILTIEEIVASDQEYKIDIDNIPQVPEDGE